MEHDNFLFESKKYFLPFLIGTKKDQMEPKRDQKGANRTKRDKKGQRREQEGTKKGPRRDQGGTKMLKRTQNGPKGTKRHRNTMLQKLSKCVVKA